MTDFYAYFKPTGTVTDRVGAVSAEAARGTEPDPFDLIAHVKQPHGADPRVYGVAVELVEHTGAITDDAVLDALIGDGSPDAEIREVVHLSCAALQTQAVVRV